MKSTARAFVFALLLPVVASAQDSINGSWAAPAPEGSAQSPVQLSLTVTDGTVTGSVILPGGVELSVQDGLLAGARIEFKTTQTDGDKAIVWRWIGTVKTDEIAFTRAAGDGQGTAEELVVLRQK